MFTSHHSSSLLHHQFYKLFPPSPSYHRIKMSNMIWLILHSSNHTGLFHLQQPHITSDIQSMLISKSQCIPTQCRSSSISRSANSTSKCAKQINNIFMLQLGFAQHPHAFRRFYSSSHLLEAQCVLDYKCQRCFSSLLVWYFSRIFDARYIPMIAKVCCVGLLIALVNCVNMPFSWGIIIILIVTLR